MKIFKRLRLRFQSKSALVSSVADIQYELERIQNTLKVERDSIATLKSRLDDALEKVNDFRKLKEQLETEVEKLNRELEVHKDVTVPTLVAAHDLVLERTKADLAAQVYRQQIPTQKSQE